MKEKRRQEKMFYKDKIKEEKRTETQERREEIRREEKRQYSPCSLSYRLSQYNPQPDT